MFKISDYVVPLFWADWEMQDTQIWVAELTLDIALNPKESFLVISICIFW